MRKGAATIYWGLVSGTLGVIFRGMRLAEERHTECAFYNADSTKTRNGSQTDRRRAKGTLWPSNTL
ncbi:MAG: hypothetical protein JWP89_5645 [Schlesneria sp.]|nr:hypothetical protein [Schlesneria sp.]